MSKRSCRAIAVSATDLHNKSTRRLRGLLDNAGYRESIFKARQRDTYGTINDIVSRFILIPLVRFLLTNASMTAKANYSRVNAVTEVIVPCAAVFGEIKTSKFFRYPVPLTFEHSFHLLRSRSLSSDFTKSKSNHHFLAGPLNFTGSYVLLFLVLCGETRFLFRACYVDNVPQTSPPLAPINIA